MIGAFIAVTCFVLLLVSYVTELKDGTYASQKYGEPLMWGIVIGTLIGAYGI